MRRPSAPPSGSCDRRADIFLVSPRRPSPLLCTPHAARRGITLTVEFLAVRAKHGFFEICRTPELAIDVETFALRMQHIVLNVKRKTFSLGQIKISDILRDVLRAVRKHHVKMEGDFVNTVISVLLLEGIGRQLDPGLDLFKSALPILRQLGRQMSTQENMKQMPSGEVGAFLKVCASVYRLACN